MTQICTKETTSDGQKVGGMGGLWIVLTRCKMRKAHLIEGYGLLKELGDASQTTALCSLGAPLVVDMDRDPIILNGPRPFPADLSWTGEFLSGVFWGAVYPGSPDWKFIMERAQQLDIAKVEFHTSAEVWDWAVGYYAEQYAEDPHVFDYQDIAMTYWSHLRE